MTAPQPDDAEALISEARAAWKAAQDIAILGVLPDGPPRDYTGLVKQLAIAARCVPRLADALENTEAARKVEFEIATHWHDIAMKLQGVRP